MKVTPAQVLAILAALSSTTYASSVGSGADSPPAAGEAGIARRYDAPTPPGGTPPCDPAQGFCAPAPPRKERRTENDYVKRQFGAPTPPAGTPPCEDDPSQGFCAPAPPK